MATWKEFKEEIERQGVCDYHQIEYIHYVGGNRLDVDLWPYSTKGYLFTISDEHYGNQESKDGKASDA